MERRLHPGLGNVGETRERIAIAHQIVVATNSFYSDYQAAAAGRQRNISDTDGIRGDLALEGFERALRLGIRVVVADAGSTEDFLSKLGRFENQGLTVIHATIAKRAPQRREAFTAAMALTGGNVVVYIQAEKAGLVDHLVDVAKPIIAGQAAIVLPKRNPVLWEETYPPYMRKSEIIVNRTYNWLMKRRELMKSDEDFDWFFGPVAFHNSPDVTSLFMKQYLVVGEIRSHKGATTDPEAHSDGQYFPVIEALYKGMSVASVEVPFLYPALQRENEMSADRIAQFMDRREKDASAYRLEFLHFLAFLDGDSRSRVKELV